MVTPAPIDPSVPSSSPPVKEAPTEPCAPAPRSDASAPLPRVAVVGTPGSGKSLLFQRLGGRPRGASASFTTEEVESLEVQLGGQTVSLLDTPGASGLELCSEHEARTRALLQDRSAPLVVVQCLDASSLPRSLMLTAHLADLELPMVACLTMVDEALSRGQLVDPDALAEVLKVPVVPVCGLDGRGVRRLLEALPAARPAPQVGYPHVVQDRLEDMTPIASRAHRVERLLAGRHPPGALAGQSLWHMVQEAHRHWARDLAARVTRRSGLEPGRSIRSLLADAALHPVGSWLFLGLTLVGVYLLISRVGVGLLADRLEQGVAQPLLAAVAAHTAGALREILVGPFGLLSLGLFNAVFTVLPILLVFHLAFAFLEEVGYFPLLAVQFDRLLRSIGLTGKAVLPITLGFGCNSLAIQAARCLESPRQRLIACFLVVLGIPCGVQLGIFIAILSAVPLASLLGFLVVVLGVEIGAGRLLALLLPRGEQGEFLVEVRSLRAPRWGAVLARISRQLVDFVRELCPLFVLSAVVMQVLYWTGILAGLRRLLGPLVTTALGLPAAMTDVLLMALARRDVAAVMMKGLWDRGGLAPRQVLVALVVMALFVPCLNALLVLGRVLGARRAAGVFLAVMTIAVAAGTIVHHLWP